MVATTASAQGYSRSAASGRSRRTRSAAWPWADAPRRAAGVVGGAEPQAEGGGGVDPLVLAEHHAAERASRDRRCGSPAQGSRSVYGASVLAATRDPGVEQRAAAVEVGDVVGIDVGEVAVAPLAHEARLGHDREAERADGRRTARRGSPRRARADRRRGGWRALERGDARGPATPGSRCGTPPTGRARGRRRSARPASSSAGYSASSSTTFTGPHPSSAGGGTLGELRAAGDGDPLEDVAADHRGGQHGVRRPGRPMQWCR